MPAYLAQPGTCFDVILWCIARRRPVPKSTHRRQLSDMLPFITVTSLHYLITFLELFQAWESFSKEAGLAIAAFFAPFISLTPNNIALHETLAFVTTACRTSGDRKVTDQLVVIFHENKICWTAFKCRQNTIANHYFNRNLMWFYCDGKL